MLKRNYLIIFLLIFLSNCVYYNTFFNAKKYFQMAQDAPLRSGRPTPQAMLYYTNAIQRCAYIIEEYPNSRWVDDALFLLGKCFYYRGNGYRQAIETFEELVTKFPDSEFTPPAYIYIAKSHYEQRDHARAKIVLQDFITNPEYKKYHSEALLLLANYYLEDDNFTRTEQYLNMIIDEFPRSQEYQTAFLLLGKTYQEAENYGMSNLILNDLVNARVDRSVKLEARFLIAKNYLSKKNYDEAIDFSIKLMTEQYSEEDRSRTRLILARSYVGAADYDKAQDLFELIIHENPRTEISAEAHYFLAEMYFHHLYDYQEAIENYNKVRQQASGSKYVSNAMTKSSIASQIVQYRSPGQDVDVVNLAEQQFKLAEYFILELDFPDSALVVYNEIIENEVILQTTIDSLETSVYVLSSELIQQYPLFQDKRDSLNVVVEIIRRDTLLADSTRAELTAKVQDYRTTKTQLVNARTNMNFFLYDVVPFAYFCKTWLYKNVFADTDRAINTMNELKTNFPESRFTYAAENLMQGNKVEFIKRDSIQKTEEYQAAIDKMGTNPQDSVPIFQSIIEDKEHPFFQESLFLLGHIHYFQLADSLQAKTYFDSLVNLPQYKEPLLQRLAVFYDGENFKEETSLKAMEKYRIEPEKEEKTDKDKEDIESTKE